MKHPPINQPFTSRFAQEKCIPPPTINSAETPGPASWWNHSTPLAAWKPFKASCTPSSFSPGNNGDVTGNNDLTWFNQQNCAMTFGISTRKNEHKWGPAGDSNTKNTSSFIALSAHIVENQTHKKGPCALSYVSVLNPPLPSDPSAWCFQPGTIKSAWPDLGWVKHVQNRIEKANVSAEGTHSVQAWYKQPPSSCHNWKPFEHDVKRNDEISIWCGNGGDVN